MIVKILDFKIMRLQQDVREAVQDFKGVADPSGQQHTQFNSQAWMAIFDACKDLTR